MIAIIGSGYSGLLSSILIKQKFPKERVLILDKNNIIGRKLLATGNGRCNLGNSNLSFNPYNNEIIYDLVKKYNMDYQKDFYLNNFSIKLRNLDNLYYPYSLSAKQFTDVLIKEAKRLGVDFIMNTKVIDYIYKDGGNRSITLVTDNKKYEVDKVIFASGGKSTPNLGSDGSILTLLKDKNYKINDLKPGLCPIKLVENTKIISKHRLKCLVKLNFNNNLIYKEEGEVIFKDDGISGISIFNVASIINRNKNINFKDYKIVLDLFPLESEEELFNELKNNYRNNNNLFENYFEKEVSYFIFKTFNLKYDQNKISDGEILKVVKILKNLELNIKDTYSFKDSQVSIGGISLDNINISTFESKKEKGIYFLGEMLDSDGLCGGYNLMSHFSIVMQFISNLVLTKK